MSWHDVDNAKWSSKLDKSQVEINPRAYLLNFSRGRSEQFYVSGAYALSVFRQGFGGIRFVGEEHESVPCSSSVGFLDE